jgi:hypothetical protein
VSRTTRFPNLIKLKYLNKCAINGIFDWGASKLEPVAILENNDNRLQICT